MENKDAKNNQKVGPKKNGVTRREWLIDVGKAAALAGMSGNATSLDAEGTAGVPDSEKKLVTLPPGLYRPSSGHLGKALEDDSRFHPIPPGCQVDFIRPRTGPYEPQFFSPDEYKVIHQLTALMLGEPSASAAKGDGSSQGNIVDEVAEWIDLHAYSFAQVREAAGRLTPEQVALATAYNGARLLKRIKGADRQKTYREGLAWIEEESRRRHQHGFIELAEKQQIAILDIISDERAGEGGENDGTRFFRQLKDDIISGFYTSKTGLKELDDKANRFYAYSPGCPSTASQRLKSKP